MKLKTIFLGLLTIVISLHGSVSTDRIQTLQTKEQTIVNAIISYTNDKGSKPIDIQALKTSFYLSTLFTDDNIHGGVITMSYYESNGLIINSGVTTSDTDTEGRDYYLNNPNNVEHVRNSYLEATILKSKYTLDTKISNVALIKSSFLNEDFIGDAEPSTYSGVVADNIWLNSNYMQVQPKILRNGLWEDFTDNNQNFNPVAETFSGIDSLVLTKNHWDFTKVDITTVNKAIECLTSGSTYNPYTDRCEGYTDNACTDGVDLFDTSLAKCTYRGSSSARSCSYSATSHVTTTVNKAILTLHAGEYYYEGGLLKIRNWHDVTNGVIINRSMHLPQWNFLGVLRISNNKLQAGSSYYSGGFKVGSWTDIPSWGVWIGAIWDTQPNSIFYVQYQTYLIDWADASKIDKNLMDSRYDPQTMVTPESYLGVLKIVSSGGGTTSHTTYSCPSGGSLSGSTCYKTCYNYSCASGYTRITSSGTSSTPPTDNCRKAPSCTGKSTVSAKGTELTPYYGNNGVCYGDTALFCKVNSTSWQGSEICYQDNETCNNSTYTLRNDTDVCEKFTYSCVNPKNRYGLIESPANNNSTDLYDRVLTKFDKAVAFSSLLLVGDLNVNDNNGAMCVENIESTLLQNTTAPLYNINGITKSGF